MTAVPYTATYQSWQSKLFSGSAAQLGPTLPGFDEQEKQVFRGSAWQVPAQTNSYTPFEAESADDPAVYPLLPTDSVQDDTACRAAFSCSDQYLPPGAYRNPYALPAVQQECVDLSRHNFAAAAAPNYRAHLFYDSHTAAEHACEGFAVNLTEPEQLYCKPIHAAASAGIGSHGNPFWEPPKTELQHDYGIAVGWTVPHCTGSVHPLSSPALNDAFPLPEHGQRHSAAIPFEPHQLQAEGTSKPLMAAPLMAAPPHVPNKSQQLQSMQMQTSCSVRDCPVSMVKGLSCMFPDDKVRSAASDISTAKQTSTPAEDADPQCQALNTSKHKLAGGTANCGGFKQVKPHLACCAGKNIVCISAGSAWHAVLPLHISLQHLLR